MEWNLHIDDDALTPGLEDFRYPPADEPGWYIATSSTEAMALVEIYGIPRRINFDHDLAVINGVPDTSMVFLKWLADKYPEAILSIEDYRVHSRNPEGAKNIESFMESWRRSITL